MQNAIDYRPANRKPEMGVVIFWSVVAFILGVATGLYVGGIFDNGLRWLMNRYQ